MEQVKYFLVAKIIASHGIKGQVKIKSFTDFPQRFEGRDPVMARNAKGETIILNPESCRWQKEIGIVKFAQFSSPEDALPWLKADLLIKEEQLSPLPEGRFYWHQIIGLQVYLEDGSHLGTVTDIMQPGANDVYVIKLSETGDQLLPHCKGELLLPVIDQVILATSIEEGKLLVRLLEGM